MTTEGSTSPPPAIAASDICLVMPSYMRPDLVDSALHSIFSAEPEPAHVVVVEDSDNRTLMDDQLARFPKASLVCTGRNRGFASSANLGLVSALADPRRFAAIGLVNNDVIVDRSWLTPLADALAGYDFVVSRMVDPSGQYIDGDGDTLTAAGAAKRIHHGKSYDRPSADTRHSVAFPTGGACLIRRPTWLHVGPFDVRLRMYYEDVDWGLRALSLGYRGCCQTASVVYHHSHQTAGRQLAVQSSYRNFMRVGISRLPAVFFRRHTVKFIRSVATGFIYTGQVTSPLVAARCLASAACEFPSLLRRRREIRWRPRDINYLMSLMERQ